MVALVILVVAGLIAAGCPFKVVQQYEQGIICRSGKAPDRPCGNAIGR